MHKLLFLSLLTLFCAQAHGHDATAQATYLGNEGVLVVRGETKIVFDAFYANSYGQYTLVPDEMAQAMLAGEAPYDGIDAVFVSHVHGDHFSAEPAVAYLRAQQQVQLYGPQQVREAIVESGVATDDAIFERIHTYALSPDGAPIELTLGGLLIEATAIPHSGGERMADINNLAWRVTLDSKTTVMHLGDASTVIADYERQRAYFEKRHSHAAFPPYWLYLDPDGRKIIETYIAADQVIGVHVPASEIGNGDAARVQLGGDVFTDPGESREIARDAQ